jgi:aldehyde dehydrogenase (NAD+)
MGSISSDFNKNLFINNEFVSSKGSERLTLTNPWDESTVTTDVHVATAEDVDIAVAASREAFKKGPWKKFTGAQRAAAMLKFADLVEQHADELARVESLPTGRPISMIRHFDIPAMVSTYRYYAGWADKIAGKSFSEEDGTYKIVRYEPIGVCAGIASWNATFLYVGWKIAPALAAGNTFIFKASEKSPLGVLALAPLYAEAGFPPGVVQFVPGGRDTGAALANHMKIDKISFTGSIMGGRGVQAAATKSNMKRVTLELGGKSPCIVFNDAPMEAAIGGVGQGFLANSGQICAAASRVLVQEDIAPKFQEAVKAQFEAVGKKMGSNPLEPTTTHGPVVDKAQYDRVMSYIDIGKNDAQLLTGGSRKGDKGCLIEPTIFVNPKEGSRIWTEEIFGPVLSMQTFKTEEEAIELANDSTYGLSSIVYTKDITRALRVSSALETGGVGINGPSRPNVQTPFGGTKQSGTGRELGEEGLKAYLEPKTIHIK